MPEFHYTSLAADPAHLADVAGWFQQQWSTPCAETIQEQSDQPVDIPTPVSAVLAGSIIGVLTYKTHAVDGVCESALWINALYVRKDHRGQRTGSQLLQRGMVHAESFGARELFVYTDIPEFYVARGWSEFRSRNKDGASVLRFLFGHE